MVLSQPTLLVTRYSTVVSAMNVSYPARPHGRLFSTTLSASVACVSSSSVSLMVTMLSAPCMLVKVTFCMPASSKVTPFHVSGSWWRQRVLSRVSATLYHTKTVRCTVLSHPCVVVATTVESIISAPTAGWGAPGCGGVIRVCPAKM